MRLVLAALLFVGLAACQRTLFESLPAADTRSCDARWVGTWHMDLQDSHESGRSDDSMHAVIHEGCSRIDYFENGVEQHRFSMALHAARIAGFDVVAVELFDDEGESMFAEHEAYPFVYLRLATKHDRIELHFVDDEAVSRMLRNGEIEGTAVVPPRDRRSPRNHHGFVQNVVKGDTSAMARLVLRPDMFAADPAIVLTRVDSIPKSDDGVDTSDAP
ncbi:hypothetical protein ACQQ2N_19550 [Dokdonella sp. MW10]|uniref:hypothetical protein n=1 Tax=Dokdonella sp. MW10 TaxID=2992926 RepID=UPI003F813543